METARQEKTVKAAFSSISLPTPLMKEIEKVVEEMGYWPNKTAFIREAVMEKIDKHRKEFEAKRFARGF
jgi:metal-responsive CopG/Arc/MetJ family transcriptional regulator